MSENFNKDLDLGELAEMYVTDVLTAHFKEEVERDASGGKLWDLKSKSGKTFEVKYDKRSSITGKMAIEYNYNEKPSGIKTTKADYWVYVLGGEVWIAHTQAILQLLFAGYRRMMKVKGGDGGNSSMLLLKKEQWQKVFVKIYPDDKINA